MSIVFDCTTGETYAVPDPVIPVVIPASVTMRQARLALLDAGLLETVDDTIATTGGAAQIEWEYAQIVERNSPIVQMITPLLGLTEGEIDALFVAASAL